MRYSVIGPYLLLFDVILTNRDLYAKVYILR